VKASLILIAISASIFAQSVNAQEAASKDQRSNESDLIVPGGGGRTDILINGADFTVEVDEEESSSTLTFGGFSSIQTDNGGSQAKRDTAWSIGLAVPIGGADDLSDEDIFEKLTDGIALKANLSTFWFTSAADALIDGNGPFRTQIMPEAIRRCEALETDKSLCDQLPNPQFARKYLNDNRVNRSLFSTMWRIGADAEIKLDRFTVLDSQTIAENDQIKPTFSAGIYGAAYPSDAKSAVVVRAGYENSFEAEDDGVVCKPVVVIVSDDCGVGVTDEPVNVEQLNLSFEYRQAFELGSGSTSIAFAPKFEIDAIGGEWTGSVPVYLLLDTDLPFQPGFSIDYDSEDDDVSFGIFIRTNFGGLLGQ
jgi:hypothetical protein